MERETGLITTESRNSPLLHAQEPRICSFVAASHRDRGRFSCGAQLGCPLRARRSVQQSVDVQSTPGGFYQEGGERALSWRAAQEDSGAGEGKALSTAGQGGGRAPQARSVSL